MRLLKHLSVAGRRVLSTAMLIVVSLPAAHGAEPVPATMRKLADDVSVLLPVIYRNETPLTPVTKARIGQQIDSMLSHIGQLQQSVAPRSDTYQISHQTLIMQLQQAKQALATGRERHGIYLLRSATSVCATCHTQDERSVSWLTPVGDAMNDPFIAGEYFFITRQYDRAFAAYHSLLRQQRELVYDQRTLTAVDRMLVTSLQMEKDPQLIITTLQELTHREHIHPTLKKDLTDWISGIGELQKLTDIRVHPKPDTAMAMANQWINAGKNEPLGRILMPEVRRPQIVWLRGELYRALTAATERDKIASLLYWLALCDRVLEYRFYYSLADMYLKQCMLEYTDTPMAQNCYREYENYIVFSYSGSAGTDLPAEVAQELEQLKATVFKVQPPIKH